MVDSGIFCTTAEVQYKAGAKASSVSNTETYINSYVAQAESYINVKSGYNWSGTGIYTALPAGTKGILKMAASDIAATYVMTYDLSGWRLAEAQTMMNWLWNRAEKCIEALQKEGNKITFVQNGA